MLLWLTLFLACAAIIGMAGWVLIEATDVIAERTGLGRAFIGMILVATITSLPELSTGVSAAAAAHAPDIAVGNIVGSSVFNLALFALADAAAPRVAFYGRLRSSHNLTGAFGIMLLGLLALAILAPETARLSIGHVGLYSVLLALLYVGAARLLYAVEVSAAPLAENTDTEPEFMSLRTAITRCAIAAIAVTAAGGLLAISAGEIAAHTGLSQSFVGVLMVAAATSLPELVTVLAAIRLQAYDLAAGSLLGSNLFNMAVLAVSDLFYFDGPLLARASDTLAAPAVIAMIMTAVIIAALNFVRRTVPGPVDIWAGGALIGLYLFNAWLIFGAG